MMAAPVSNINRLVPGLIEKVKPAGADGAKAADKADGSFGDLLSKFVNGVNDLHHDSAEIQQAFLNGDPVELHQVMIKAEEAGVATELLIEIRNKLLDAYSELIRMPV